MAEIFLLRVMQEEKIRHQKLYPDYRYQPRRGGRQSSLSNSLPSATSSSNEEARRCGKCGGRSINTPNIMSRPGFSASSGSASSTPFSPNRPPSTPSTGSSAHRFLQGFTSPQITVPSNGFRPRPDGPSSDVTALRLASPRPKRDNPPLSPESKRRRVANGTYASARAPNGQLTPFPFPQRRRESLPRPDFMPAQKSNFTMGPPPRPNSRSHPDSSLTLPPLKTSSTGLGSPGTVQAKSLEAMVMSIPTLNKIRVLAKISPPLSKPGPSSPVHGTRGFVIAIEGLNAASVSQITETLSASLSPYHPIRVFESPSELRHPHGEPGRADNFQSYLQTISQYHTLSAEIISYITTPLSRSASPPASPSPVSPKSTPLSSKPITRSHSTATPHDPKPTSTGAPGVPIAILPSFQLSHTDVFASCIPITDAYAPIDHWQWMATLWRGIVGPDITVALLPPAPATPPQSASSGASGDVPPRLPSGSSTGGTPPGVEARLDDSRAILVREENGKGGVGEAKLRRLGFEVGEWVRGNEEDGSRD